MIAKTKQHIVRALRFSERYTKTDMVYATKGGVWLSLGQAWAAGGAFVLSLIIARYIPAEVYGSYRYILSVVSIVGALSLTGLGLTVTNAVARGLDGTLKKSFLTSLIWSIPSALILAGMGVYYWWNENIPFAGAFLIAGAMTPLINSGVLYSAFLGGKKDFARQTSYWIVGNTLTISALILTAIFTDRLLALIAAYFISSAAGNLFLYLRVRGMTQNNEADNGSVKLASHLSLIGLLNTITANIDRILVFQLLGPAQLAIYTFANAIPEQMRALVKMGARLALPKFSERTFTEIQGTLLRKLTAFAAVILAGSVLYIFAAPFLYEFLFPAYQTATPYSQFIALSLVFTLGAIPLAALQAHAKTASLYRHSVITNVLQISGTVICISFWGIWGAVAALIANRAIGFLLSLYLVVRARE